MTFLNTSVLLGILSGNEENGYNLINSPLYAKEAGLKVVVEGTNKKDDRYDNVLNVLEISITNDNLPPLRVEGMLIYYFADVTKNNSVVIRVA